MTSAATGDLNATSVIALIEGGGYPRELVANFARGFLPLPQEELIGVLAYLAASEDGEIASLAKTSLFDVPRRALFEFASNETIESVHLVRLMDLVTSETLVLEALIRNRAVPDAAIAELARRADPNVQDVIVINQARILRAPEILDALLENPELSPDARRRALETKEEFFEKKARLQQMEEEAAAARAAEAEIDAPLEVIADLLERASEQDEQGNTTVAPISESERADPEKAALWGRINFMTVAEKVQLAFRGDRTARMLLVRERNKLVCSAVMRNPRLTDTEVESIAGMRNVDEEVLRLIGTRREWIAKYNIIFALVRNPKAPLGVVLPFINRLTLRDLKGLKDDKGVQQVVREMAKKAFLQRTQKS